MADEQFIPTRQVSDLLGYSTTKPVWHMLNDGILEGHKKGGRWVVSLTSVQALIDERNLDKKPVVLEEGRITTSQAANILGTKLPYVTKLCANGTLDAIKVGREWHITLTSVMKRYNDLNLGIDTTGYVKSEKACKILGCKRASVYNVLKPDGIAIEVFGVEVRRIMVRGVLMFNEEDLNKLATVYVPTKIPYRLNPQWTADTYNKPRPMSNDYRRQLIERARRSVSQAHPMATNNREDITPDELLERVMENYQRRKGM